VARVEVIDSLKKEVFKKFKGESKEIFKHLESLGENPHKGKLLGNVAGFLIKELKYKSFRFYFIVEGNKLNFYSKEELIDILMKFVRMSDKDAQQKTINEIREVLIKIGIKGF